MIPVQLPFLKPHLHPLLFVVAALMLGITWQALHYNVSIFILLALIIGSAVVLSASIYNKYLLIGSIVCIYFVGAYRMHTIQHQHAAFYTDTAGKTCTVLGYITDQSPIEHPMCNQRITCVVHKIHTNIPHGRWQPCDATIQIYTRKNHLRVGDTVNMSGLEFKQAKNGSFNDYLLKEGVTATVFVPKLDALIINRPTYSWTRWLFNLRQKVHTTLHKKLGNKTFALFSSIFLGNKPLPKKSLEHSKEHFNTWGVTHYLARSGLHMVIFVLVWHFFLNMLPLYFVYKQMILIVLSIIYCLLSWPSVSFTRALLSFLLYKSCTLLRITTNFLHILTLVCCAVLLYNPLHLFFLDFQLSFGLTFALGLFAQLKEART